MKRLIEWDGIEIRIAGDRVNALAQPFRVDPIEKLQLRFNNGLLRVEGSVRKYISVPFTVDVREILASGTTVRVPLTNVQAFGGLPIPQFLFPLVQSRLPKGLVTFEPPATFVVQLARFIPEFVDADIQKIWIIDGGLSVTLGRGGADPPIPGADPAVPGGQP
jgi:hypothetical protein